MGEVTKPRRTLIVPNPAIATCATQRTYNPARRRLQNLTVNAGGKSTMNNVHTYNRPEGRSVDRLHVDMFTVKRVLRNPAVALRDADDLLEFFRFFITVL